MDPLEALEQLFGDVADAAQQWEDDINNIDPQFEEMFEPGVLDGITSDLDLIKEKGDDPVLTMADQATAVIDPILAKIDEFAQVHTATLTVDDQTGGGGGGGGNGGGEEPPPPHQWTQKAMGSPYHLRVPGGFSQDNYRVNMRSGEEALIWKGSKGMAMGGGGGLSVDGDINIHVSENVDIDTLLEMIDEAIEETR
jgi:hypothetical protein